MWRQQHGKLRPGALRIAISFYKATYYGDETELLDAVIAQIERSGAEAIPAFGYPGEAAVQRLLLAPDGASRADVVLGFNFNFSAPDASAALAKVDVPVLNLISLYGRGAKEWRESPMGLSMFEGTFNIAVPELAGTIAPTVVGSQEKVTDPDTGLTIVVRKPIPSQIAMAVRRAAKWGRLKGTANRDKRVALVFYNYPAGKANIGASYLNVAKSLANILQRLKADGYDVGNGDLSGEAVLQTLLEKARNVGGYAPGELQALVDAGSAITVSRAQYTAWLDALTPSLKDRVLKDWGAPGASRLMTADGSLVIPAAQFGKIVLLPQPSRGWGEDSEKDGHERRERVRIGPASTNTWNLNLAVADSDVWVVFDAETSTRSSELFLGRVDASGAHLVRLTADDGAPSKYPDLKISGEGQVALTWYDMRDGNEEVYLFVGLPRDSSGEIERRAHRVTTTAGESVGAYLAWNAGRVGLAWSDKTPGAHEIYFQSFDRTGAQTGPAERVTQTDAWSLVPAIRPWRDRFALAWTEYQPASSRIHDGTGEVDFTVVG